MLFHFPLLNLGGFVNAQFFLAQDYTNKQVISAISVILLSFAAIKLVNYILQVRLKEIAERTESVYDEKLLEAVTSPINVFLYFTGFYLAINILNPSDYRDLITRGIQIFMVVDVVWLIFRLSDLGTSYLQEKQEDQRQVIKTVYPLINKTFKVFVAGIAFIMVVQNLGYSVSSLLAGLGIGGLAVALAAKDTISNIFGSLTIFLDKSLFIGDWVKIGSAEGVVEDVGFRTTKIRTFSKSLVVIPNSEIANNHIENISRRGMQRVVMDIGVTYNTSAVKMKLTLEELRRIVTDHPLTNKENIYVYFSEFRDSSLNIFLYFFIESTVWRDFLGAREEINLEIMQKLEEMGVEFAFPTRTLYIEDPKKENMLTKF